MLFTLSVALTSLAAGRALAFDDGDRFAYPPGAAGGGGRYYTGSPRDAQTCQVCHRGGESPAVEVRGLPLRGYQPGARYEIIVDWPDHDKNVSLTVEVTDREGRRAGELALPPEDETFDPEWCEPASDKLPAAYLHLVPPLDSDRDPADCADEAGHIASDCRQVITEYACGAKRLRFAWRAPNKDVGPLWFAGSLVRADGDGQPSGDGVRELTRIMGGPSTPDPLASSTRAGCAVLRLSASREPAGSIAACCLFAAATLGLGRCIRRRRAARARGRRA